MNRTLTPRNSGHAGGVVLIITGLMVITLVAAACAGNGESDAALPTTSASASPLPNQPAQSQTTQDNPAQVNAPQDPATVATSTITTPASSTPAPIEPGLPLVTLAPDAAVCDNLQQVEVVGALSSDLLAEVSGLAASRTQPGVIWAHNDSGDDALVYALDSDGSLLSVHLLSGVFPLDWEDMAIGPGPDPSRDYLYVGDIGDNLHFRPDVLVYRIPEPTAGADSTIDQVERIRLVYPEPGINSEALMVDPVTRNLYLLEKTPTDAATIYRADADLLLTDHPAPLDPVGTLGIEPGVEVTAADFSPSGDRISVRGYKDLWVWPRTGSDPATDLAQTPCNAVSPDEVQGEAITWSAQATGIYSISEGTGAAVHLVGAP